MILLMYFHPRQIFEAFANIDESVYHLFLQMMPCSRACGEEVRYRFEYQRYPDVDAYDTNEVTVSEI